VNFDSAGIRLGLLLVGATVVSMGIGYFSDTDLNGPRRPLPDSIDRAWIQYPPAAAPSGEKSGEVMAELKVLEDHWSDDVVGTAFAVGPHTWITAGHVLEACTKAYVRVHRKWLPFTDWTFHPTADVAIAHTGGADQPPVIGVTERLPVMGQDGFHYGFPHGKPAEVRSQFIGEARLRPERIGKPVESGWVWAEQERTAPDGSLGGISGGPQVDRTGAVQGVTILEWPRRGRVVTAPMARMKDLMPDTIHAVDSGGTSIDALNFTRHGTQVRGTNAVSFVYCSLDGKTKPDG
jgi:hypothetical protein